jgi:hypothetical protein
VYELSHVSALTYPAKGVITTKYVSQHVNVTSAPPYGNGYSLKILKCIKLMAINYSIMILNTDIPNILATTVCQFLVVFMCVEDVYKHRS